jgi:hypothetical protein
MLDTVRHRRFLAVRTQQQDPDDQRSDHESDQRPP